jgi:hypothetical protein
MLSKQCPSRIAPKWLEEERERNAAFREACLERDKEEEATIKKLLEEGAKRARQEVAIQYPFSGAIMRGLMPRYNKYNI